MACSAAFVYSPDLAAYDHGPAHPLKPARFVLTRELCDAYGLLTRPNVRELPPRMATNDEVQLVHSAAYIEAVTAAGQGAPGDWWQFALGTGDNPIFHDMHDASARVVGATLRAAELIYNDEADHAFSPAGGLHHAMRDKAWGFCVYNDPAIAIAWLLEQGLERIAYVDVDVHHGDGVQAAFYEDPRVLTISIHESGRYLFPGTGSISERGEGDAEGTSVNIPLPPFTEDDEWLTAFRGVVPTLVKAFEPQLLVTQLGCDTHHTDPLAHMALSTRAYRAAAALLHELAHDAADGRWLATGGGGYRWATVAPRAWTIAFAEMAGARLDDRLPHAWRQLAEQRAHEPIPETFSEDAPHEHRYEGEIERIVETVKSAIYPFHGLPTD